MRRLALLAIIVVLSAVGCAGSDERVAAVQRAYDASHLAWTYVPTGNNCYDGTSTVADPNRYVGVPGATVGPDTYHRTASSSSGGAFFPKIRYCRTVSWDPKLLVSPNEVSIGRYVVEKVGPSQNVYGIEEAPVRAKLELSALGRSMVDHDLVLKNRLEDNTYVTLSKDADGQSVAKLPGSLAPGP